MSSLWDNEEGDEENRRWEEQHEQRLKEEERAFIRLEKHRDYVQDICLNILMAFRLLFFFLIHAEEAMRPSVFLVAAVTEGQHQKFSRSPRNLNWKEVG